MERLGSAWRVMGGAGGASAESDERVAAAAGEGDAAAFRALAQRYSQPAFNYAYRLLGAYDDAQDAVQETLIQLFQSLPAAKRDLPFRPWFYRILRRKCLDVLRRRTSSQRSAAFANDGVADDAPDDTVADAGPLPEELFERRDLQRLLQGVIAELPPRYREVVLLRYVADLTFDEIGTALDLPVNTVKTRFQRAKRMLKPLLLARHVVARQSAPADGAGPSSPRRPAGKEDKNVDPR